MKLELYQPTHKSFTKSNLYLLMSGNKRYIFKFDKTIWTNVMCVMKKDNNDRYET
jgi:hypothetical protein